VLVGYVIGVGLGVPLGLAMGMSRTFPGVSCPVLEVLRPMCRSRGYGLPDR
jgi:ABC-type nitrate/sulfonate/bicarbonate transport system permease component